MQNLDNPEIKNLVDDVTKNISVNLELYSPGEGQTERDFLIEYQMCEEIQSHTSWLHFAFSDIGADLNPEDYDFEEYYDDEISDSDREYFESEIEKLFEN